MKYAQKATAIFSIFLLFLTACGGGNSIDNSSNDNDNTKTVSISITQTLSMLVGETKTLNVTTQNTDFTVSVSPASGSGCAKSVNNAVSCTPTETGAYTVTATATADTSKSAAATVDVNIELPEFIGIENFGNQIDYAVLGLDGSGFFYEFQDGNPDIPKRLTIYDGNKNQVESVVNFDEAGLPKNIVSKDLTIVFGNFVGNRYDAVLITKNGETHLLENIETDIYWDEYKNWLLSGGMSYASALAVVPQFLNIGKIVQATFKPVVQIANIAVSTLGCGTSIVATIETYGLALPLAAISCGQLASQFGAFSGWYEMPKVVDDLFNYGDYYTTTMFCAGGVLNDCIEGIVGEILTIVDNAIGSVAGDIRLGEGILQTGSGNVQITLIWDNYADIDLHCIDPAGVHIYYGNDYSYYTGGFLDYDNIVAYGPENIYFSPAPAGTYRVYIHYYSANYGISSVRYQVAVNINGRGYVYEGVISGQGSTVDIVTFTIE